MSKFLKGYLVKNLIHRIIHKALFRPNIRDYIIRQFLLDPEYREWVEHKIEMYETLEVADFDMAPLEELRNINGFEDFYWLFSSNELNLGLSQLRFDDAAYLYRQLICRNHPRVVELGRYKGGTTFLLAAAGAKVLSLENDPRIHRLYTPPLVKALRHFSLADEVEAILGDAYSYNPGSDVFDFVLVHCSPPSYENTRVLVEHWWPRISVGGYLILHATPFLPGELAFIEEMKNSLDSWNAILEKKTPGENVYFKKCGSKPAITHVGNIKH